MTNDPLFKMAGASSRAAELTDAEAAQLRAPGWRPTPRRSRPDWEARSWPQGSWIVCRTRGGEKILNPRGLLQACVSAKTAGLSGA